MLQSHPLFAELSKESLEILEKSAKKMTLKKNTQVFSQGDRCEYLYILTKGQVKLYRSRKGSTKEEIVCVIDPDGYFCLAPLLSRDSFHISAKTLKESELWSIPRETILKLIDLSHEFAKKIISSLAQKECSLCEEVCDLSLSTTKERLAKYLFDLSQNSRKPFTLPLHQSDLASHLGTVRETLSRDLASLKKARIIKISKGTCEILNTAELSSIANKKIGKSTRFEVL